MPPDSRKLLRRLAVPGLELLHDTTRISLNLFRIMIPVILSVKLLQELGLIRLLGVLLGPVMRLVGLPGEMGIVWATAMVTSLYGGIISYLSLAAEYPLTCAQITVLSGMMLLAHALPVEGRIARKSGTRYIAVWTIRIGGAFVFALILHAVFSTWDLCQEPAQLTWVEPPVAQSWIGWGWSQLKNLAKIYCIILLLMLLLKILRLLGIADLLERALRPLLAPLGIGREALNITTIGMVLGLSYGGGLIIEEVRKGHIGQYDIFFSLTLMGLCHSVVEDSLIILTLGGTFWGVVVARLGFTVLVMWGLVAVCRRLKPETFAAWCQEKP